MLGLTFGVYSQTSIGGLAGGPSKKAVRNGYYEKMSALENAKKEDVIQQHLITDTHWKNCTNMISQANKRLSTCKDDVVKSNLLNTTKFYTTQKIQIENHYKEILFPIKK